METGDVFVSIMETDLRRYRMKAALYQGQGKIELTTLPDPV
jgi:hypothetical protein